VPFLRHISVEGLFGLYDHSLDLRDAPAVTIVAGPNGVGKTTLLGMATALSRGSFREVAKQDFTSLSITSSDGTHLVATALPASASDDDDLMSRSLRLELKGPQKRKQTDTLVVPIQKPAFALPNFLEQIAPDAYRDKRDGELLSGDEVIQLFGRPTRDVPPVQRPDWFNPGDWRIDFIETKRLDTLQVRPRDSRVQRIHRRRVAGQAPIYHYLSQVADSMDHARSNSNRITQERNRSFARRLLDKASRMTVNEDVLRARYVEVGKRALQLTANGLLADSLDMLPGGHLNPTEKRILSFFLDDFEAKLTPLSPISAKMDQLRAIIERKFLNKSIRFDSQQGVQFVAEPHQREIDPEALSSGEQHELALISRLLFAERPGTTVLIDEPELSLHVSWQHEMVEDLIEIARVAELSFVLATHSTAIINGRWDLVEELGPLEKHNK
jgi:ABC-type lipoprotein export system ATPase subunit